MNLDKNNQYGSINVSLEAIASVVANAALSSYGVVSMASKKNVLSQIDLKNEEDFTKGVVVKRAKANNFEVDLFIIIAYGVRITEIVGEVQKRVRYELELKFDIKVKTVNVYVQGIKNI
jgi:uncharacterized alkaline shock family protein YloU